MTANRQDEYPATVVQPSSVQNAGPAIAQHGEAKYGTKLKPENGRVALVDAYQEVLDLAQHIRQELEERRRVAEIPGGARRRVLYFAAPLRPTADEIQAVSLRGWPSGAALRSNLDRAKEGLSALRRSFQETTFIAPWISSVLSGEDDRDPAQREAGLVDACAVVERCDGIVLWGSRLSDGMRRDLTNDPGSHQRSRKGRHGH